MEPRKWVYLAKAGERAEEVIATNAAEAKWEAVRLLKAALIEVSVVVVRESKETA